MGIFMKEIFNSLNTTHHSSNYLILIFVGALAICIGFLLTIWPLYVISVVFFALSVPIGNQFLKNLYFWQVLTGFVVVAYASLNYGFANYSLPLILTFPVGYIFLALSSLLALIYSKKHIVYVVKEPVIWLSLLLFFLALCHLIFDVPNKGLYAIRDANYTFEIFAMVCGFLWALQTEGEKTFLKLLFALFIITFIYSLTYPFRDILIQFSPIGGLFREVPLFGAYVSVSLYLVSGSIFFILVAPLIWKKHAILWYVLGASQLAWSFVFQERSMYIGLLLSAIVLMLFSDIKGLLKFLFVSLFLVIIAILIVDIYGFEIKGRVSDISLLFFVDHIQSIFLTGDSVGVETSRWRIDLWLEVLNTWRSTFSSIVFGSGFGDPLTHHILTGGAEIRQPHNTHLTVLARMGLIGLFIWLLILARIIYLLIRVLKISTKKTLERGIVVWLILFYMLGLLLTSVQPWLEFSYGAIPFFVVLGFAVGWAKLQLISNRK